MVRSECSCAAPRQQKIEAIQTESALTVVSSSRGPAGVQRPRDDSIASNEPFKMALSHVRVLEGSLVVLQIQSK